MLVTKQPTWKIQSHQGLCVFPGFSRHFLEKLFNYLFDSNWITALTYLIAAHQLMIAQSQPRLKRYDWEWYFQSTIKLTHFQITCSRFSPRSSSTRFVSFLKAFGWTSRILQYWTKIFWRLVISSWNNVTLQNWAESTGQLTSCVNINTFLSSSSTAWKLRPQIKVFKTVSSLVSFVMSVL